MSACLFDGSPNVVFVNRLKAESTYWIASGQVVRQIVFMGCCDEKAKPLESESMISSNSVQFPPLICVPHLPTTGQGVNKTILMCLWGNQTSERNN